ncbi:hypothetical protein [Prosthecobacter sp.]|uniref:hypothetical protein n=1 Tax=Prosthecobacter sp. TaxID=1965333 RepID=UPI003783FDBE
MTQADLDTLAKAPIFVFLHVASAKSSITPTDEKRFAALTEEAAKPNARVCLYTDVMRHMLEHFNRLYAEVNGSPEGPALVRGIRQILQSVPENESLRFRSHLARVAMASARDVAGHPVPAAVEMTKAMGQTFAMPDYGRYSTRLTDGLEIVDYWPGCDPLLKDFNDVELRSLAAVFGCLFATLNGCHGAAATHAFDDAVRDWLMAAYSPGKETCRVHALLRYLDQLFSLTHVEVQFTQSSLPVFQEGYALLQAKFSAEEQALFMHFFNALGTAFMTADAPPAVSEMLTKITAIMQGESVPEEDNGLQEEELDLMSLGFIAAFTLVAGADGKMGRKEMETFVNLIESLQQAEHLGPVVQALTRIPNALDSLWPIATGRNAQPMKLVQAAIRLVEERLDLAEYGAYCALIMTLAEATAEAEGGFLGLGSKISKEERAVLEQLRKIIGID